MNIELSKKQQGILYIIGGTVLFLYGTGIMRAGIDAIIVAASLLMIGYGLILINGIQSIRHWFKKRKEAKPSDQNKTDQN